LIGLQLLFYGENCQFLTSKDRLGTGLGPEKALKRRFGLFLPIF
jgi:hypothetical protein